MFRSSYRGVRRAPVRKDGLEVIREHMAAAMIGRVVNLMVDAHTVTHGVVTGVFTGRAGTPKIVVDGTRYEMSQILTVTPAHIN